MRVKQEKETYCGPAIDDLGIQLPADVVMLKRLSKFIRELQVTVYKIEVNSM